MKFRYFCILLLLCGASGASASEADTKRSELDAVKQRLRTLQQTFRDTQAHRKEAVDELRESEQAISGALRELRELDQERRRAEGSLRSLGEEERATAARIDAQQARLAEALRAAYRRGGDADALKLLLSGADPNQTARDLRYLADLSHAQRAAIDTLRADQARLAELREQAEHESVQLEQLRAAREAEQNRLMADKQARERTLAKLSVEIQKQRREISRLKRDERTLTQLVERLNRLMARQQAEREAARARAAQQAKKAAPSGAPAPRRPVAINTETPEKQRSGQPFSRLKGSLRLPVAGELMNRFGASREGGGLSWKGLFIRAGEGAAVKAIAAGQVVFAEWLRGFGNLIIVDHGEGYMSLYSNNESLYKQVGERVQAGDAIAAVGNSGGQPDPGLYFEMRHQGRPLNPIPWMK
ncbi:MAG TPA: peptidoglycan DD-metalloendopeptidase family protein [Thiobacillaceae bacterium]|nr:peptidoglycan DD-metalloendopeptidase family protein [Thiobacillaceae bacterium]